MAIRYSGNVTIKLLWLDAEDLYKCILTWGQHRLILSVGSPKILTKAVDSPEAYDEAAHAALSFATDEDDGPSDSDIAYRPDGRGTFHVARKAAEAWGPKAEPEPIGPPCSRVTDVANRAFDDAFRKALKREDA